MAKGKKRRVRIEFVHSSPVLKILLIVTIVMCTVALLSLKVAITRTESETALLRQQAARLEQENAKLARNIAEIGTVQGIKRIASEMLDLVEAGSSFFTPEESNP